MKIYNAEELILGRLASVVAKELLLGEDVVIINCEKAVISGRKENLVARENWKRSLTGYPLKTPSRSRLPDRFVRLVVRRMLPWKIARGKEAYKHVMCYRGIPEEFQGKEMLTVKGASAQKLPILHRMQVGALCKSIGGHF
ncbi:MAG: 50S ribosomal protein L13 [Nanoarchaeota archaeon]